MTPQPRRSWREQFKAWLSSVSLFASPRYRRPLQRKLSYWLSKAGIHFQPQTAGAWCYLSASLIGWCGLTLATIVLACVFQFYVIVFQTMRNPDNPFVAMRMMGTILYWLFIVSIRIFSGLMGWGADIDEDDILWRILGSIPNNAPPSRISYYWCLPTTVCLFVFFINPWLQSLPSLSATLSHAFSSLFSHPVDLD